MTRKVAHPRIGAIVVAVLVAACVLGPARPAEARGIRPGAGQAAYAFGSGPIHRGPSQHVAPIASMAKLMTAYLVLRAAPMTRPGGFTMTVTRRDVADWRLRQSRGESTVAVRVGERLTERQALDALLLPSANNIAIMLARRIAGTVTRFVARMTRTAHRLGMRHSTYTDPSGFDARTRSTPADQIVLAREAMRLATLRATVDRPSTVIPVAGRIENTDTLLGHDGFVGIKTGSMSQSGGCFVFLSHRHLNGRRVAVYGTVMGQPGRDLITAAMTAADRLVRAISD